jgi:hypothetical protein
VVSGADKNGECADAVVRDRKAASRVAFGRTQFGHAVSGILEGEINTRSRLALMRSMTVPERVPACAAAAARKARRILGTMRDAHARGSGAAWLPTVYELSYIILFDNRKFVNPFVVNSQLVYLCRQKLT